MSARASAGLGGPALITGGAGFIGTNVAARLLAAGERVRVLDNLSRAGVERNLEWLRRNWGDRLDVEIGDVRNARALASAVREARQVYHFAAQVAVSASLERPADDFEVNARGTLNLLEALRGLSQPPTLLYTSTHKVYGALADVPMVRSESRYAPVATEIAAHGLGEDRPLDFHSPHGCSKGAADQYVLDFARNYGLPAAVFRLGCVYGPHQMGDEDQGWVAHFLLLALDGEPIALHGDGRQVRDVLYVEDLVDAMLLAQGQMASVAGQAFNIGGGPANSISLLDLLDLIEGIEGRRPRVDYGPWRQGDQRYYVSNVRKFAERTGWMPEVGVREGVARLHGWLRRERAAAEPVLPRWHAEPLLS